MIQVLLLILKIIGIALAVILGLVLFVVLVVLFVPIRYRARIIYKSEHLEVKGRVTFLCSMLNVTVQYLEKLTYKGRLFGIVFLDSEKEKKPKNEKKPKQLKKPKESKIEEHKVEQEEVTPLEEQEEVKSEEPFVEENEQPSLDEVLDEMIAEEGLEVTSEAESKLSFFEKIRLKIEKIRDTIDNVIGKIKKIWHQKEEIQRILEKPETKLAISFAWNKIVKILRHILPRKLKGYLIFGSGDPATTGKVLAILSIVYAKTGPLIDITPNFEEKQIECDLEFKGRIQLIVLVVLAVQLILKKEVKQLIEDVKKIKDVK